MGNAQSARRQIQQKTGRIFTEKTALNGFQRLLLTSCLLLLAAVLSATEESLGPGLVNPGYQEPPSWFKESFLDLREDVAEATRAGKRVLLYFYQDGCPYCARLLQDNFADRQIAQQTRKHFDVIAINMWGDREVTDIQGNTLTEKQFAARMRVQYTPTLVFLDENGEPLARLNGYYPPHKFAVVLDYVAGRHERQRSLADYFQQVNPVPASGKLHDEPF
ncbi:MAG TPA: hypothetical protein EYP90_11825, partial [Chromatiaceae bacterium]|nr:hypothetical protein [Chromatiaceae bacterium]